MKSLGQLLGLSYICIQKVKPKTWPVPFGNLVPNDYKIGELLQYCKFLSPFIALNLYKEVTNRRN